jgi:hypothetical protein
MEEVTQTTETNSASPSISQDKLFESNAFSPYYSVLQNVFGYSISEDYDATTLRNLIKDPIGNNKKLRELSRQLYSSNGILRNTVDYMVALPTLDCVVVPMGKDVVKKKKNKELMQEALQELKHKEFLRDALWRDAIDACCFYYLELSNGLPDARRHYTDSEAENILEINKLGKNMSIISLPADYTRIFAIKNSRYVLGFDLSFFDESNLNEGDLARKLRKYPKEIRDGYRSWKNNPNLGQWLILDNKHTIAHKIGCSKEEPFGRPLVLSALLDIFYGDYFTDTKRFVLSNVNHDIIFQTFPEGQTRGISALTTAQQREQHEAVKNAIMNNTSKKGVTMFSLAAGTKLDKLTANVDILDEKMERNLNDNIAMDMGFAASLLNGSSSGNYSSQQTNLQLVMAQVFSWLDGISAELVEVINQNIIRDPNHYVKVSYLPCSIVARKEFTDQMKDLYTLGRGSLTAWVASTGIEPDAYFALLDEEIENDFETKYPPHLTSFTSSGKDNPSDDPGGRPTESNPTNPNTAASKTRGSNKNPKPSTK